MSQWVFSEFPKRSFLFKVVVSNNFHPYLGKIPILTNIFQMGWNHQPEKEKKNLSGLGVFAAKDFAAGELVCLVVSVWNGNHLKTSPFPPNRFGDRRFVRNH